MCKRLLFAECLVQDLKQAIRSLNKKVVAKLPFYTAKKYKLMSELSRNIGLNRKGEVEKKKPSKRLARKEELQETIITFLNREDNSTVLVGKKKTDAVRINGIEHQKKILNDYIHNLHEKFRKENPEIRVSRATFYNARPKYLLLANFASRRTCLCQRHQNIALKLKAIRAYGINVSKNPDTFIKNHDTVDKVRQSIEPNLPDNVKFTSWKKKIENNKSRWKEEEETVPRETFLEVIDNQTMDFRNHVARVQNQYSEMRKLRENLPDDEIVLWMDFAENFMCTSIEAIQSSYWNQSMVSLHTMVTYLPPNFDKRLQSLVAVSDVLSHNATVVYTILRKLIPQLKDDYPTLKKVHYLTDSPTSQYRNKTIFKVLADHQEDFGIEARWNYLESGHGKGPCDGLGASIKRGADMAIRQGKVLIQNGEDFFAWAKQTEENGSKIKYLFYNQEDVDIAETMLQGKDKPLPITGTFKIHAVVPISKNKVMTRDVSCSCEECLKDVKTSPHGWTEHILCKGENDNDEIRDQTENEPDDQAVDEPDHHAVDKPDYELFVPSVDSYVVANVDNEWYVGKVLKVDHEDEDAYISFMTKNDLKGKIHLQWPRHDDSVWVYFKDILFEVNEPKSVGRSRRFLEFHEDDLPKIKAL